MIVALDQGTTSSRAIVFNRDGGIKVWCSVSSGRRGAATNDTLMQIRRTCWGVRVVRPAVAETTALWAAYSSGLAVGLWKSTDEIPANGAWTSAADQLWQMRKRPRVTLAGPQRSSAPKGGK
jgi:glycerol kinase